MARLRQQEQHKALRAEIKAAARVLMEKEGTAGISIRGIGRQLGLTAPALYHYYLNRDALITDLIVDAYNALADHLELTRDQSQGLVAVERLRQVLLEYRLWALAHPVDFQLIYGNPIPDYQAPVEVTVPAATRNFLVIGALLAEMMARDDFAPYPLYAHIPPELEPHIESLASQIAGIGAELPPLACYLTTVGWPHIHGIIMLELFNHIQSVVGDMEAFYHKQVDDLIRLMCCST